jgi:hypothetical protein
MLEAVNSVIQSAPFVREQSERNSTAESYAANPERVQRTPPLAPYVSPYIYVDVNYDKAVIQLRNGDTGDVESQFPSEAALQQQARHAAAQQVAREAEFAAESAPKSSDQSAQTFVQQSAPEEPAPVAAKGPAQTAQQQAAFAAAAQAGNSNAGNVTLFA